MKRIYYYYLACLLALGCGQPDQDILRLSGWISSPSEEKLLEGALDEFRTGHPDLPFLYEPIPGNYSEKIQLMLGTGTAPDLFYLKGMTAPSYIKYEVLRPLNDFVEADTSYDVDDFYPFLQGAFERDGQYYGFSKDFNPYVMFYNKELLAEAGIDSLPQNWTELEEVARKLTVDKDGDGKPDQFGLVIEPVIDMLMAFVYQNGGQFHDENGELTLTDPAFVGALEYYYGLYQKGVAAIPTDIGVGWSGDAFGRGKAAIIFSGGWLLPFLKDNYPDVDYGVELMPAGKQRATIAFTTAYVMPKATERPEEAWELMRYLTGKEGMARAVSGFGLPARRSVARDMKLADDPIFSVFVESAEFAHPFQVSYIERWFDESQTAMQAVFFTGREPKAALEELEERIRKYKL